ncbi:Secretory antigen precursor SsaA [Staphylococcus aureus]|uniref:LysM peptidoglycan-binding domain-containing protein n=1 Tax=Staphylococcus aureus TaxID=1280 RepID=UPI000769152C|nr:LysM peptidoglycan-binding domain-containing protein [Staphylococcus aureus]CXO38692.1 Secretory antigen precursor SsaA [Staphylococcus aureus]HCY0091636.1 LysM peptidoglycan-binding domain-containing protein [Staphylococcus aureus]HEG9239493.1 LysM peptidoglycan-binding domain-containing protein [Staphylococcus aureus]HEH2051528.1 LysM peptidoglycan-binding domain-containing protein [Staphylococcus aureus]
MKKLAFAITATSGAAAFLTHHDAQASTQHTVQSGESLWSIAQKYNTSVESIKQNNQLDNNLVFPGQVISVGGSDAQNTSNTSPQAGESLNIIASRYGVSVDQLMAANNLRGYLIMPNQTLQIPNGGSGGTTPTATTGSNGNASSFNHQNLYTAGQCTWYVFDRRAQAGSPISTYWSDAKYWAGNAANDGYQVNNTPSVGSIMQSTPGPYGHVAYVERVNGDGSILISEMNYTYGPYNMNYRTIPASEVSSYAFIH